MNIKDLDPSLEFSPIWRTPPTGREIIRVGRYSEVEYQSNPPSHVPSAVPIGFKTKVASGRHCIIWYKDKQWYIKDTKSSSSTFLNYIRLSASGKESKPFNIKHRDIIPFGINFQGGENSVSRAAKLRIELYDGLVTRSSESATSIVDFIPSTSATSTQNSDPTTRKLVITFRNSISSLNLYRRLVQKPFAVAHA